MVLRKSTGFLFAFFFVPTVWTAIFPFSGDVFSTTFRSGAIAIASWIEMRPVPARNCL
jgi:hypothetical protein